MGKNTTRANCDDCGRVFRVGFSVCERPDCPFTVTDAAPPASKKKSKGKAKAKAKASAK